MSKKTMYRQCRYEQIHASEDGGKRWDQSWLPEELAKMGKVIYFGEQRSPVAKEDLYRIVLVGDHKRSGEWLSFKEGADRNQRKASDI